MRTALSRQPRARAVVPIRARDARFDRESYAPPPLLRPPTPSHTDDDVRRCACAGGWDGTMATTTSPCDLIMT